jgi:hypothetical protein
MKDGGLACSLVHGECHPSSRLEHDFAAMRRQNPSTIVEKPLMGWKNVVREEQQHEWKEGNCLSGEDVPLSRGSGTAR